MEASFEYLGNQNRKLGELGINPGGEEQLAEYLYLHFNCWKLYSDLLVVVISCAQQEKKKKKVMIKMFHPCAKRGVCVCLEGHFIQPHWGYYKRCKLFFDLTLRRMLCAVVHSQSCSVPLIHILPLPLS